uniref:Glycoprotein n=1 Tax=Rhabditophanes sp. KR3021 TaxID=114890 RepID=A0AC35TPG5_9BILA
MIVKFILFYLVFAISPIECFHDCSKKYVLDKIPLRKLNSPEKFIPKSVQMIKYDFPTDSCSYSNNHAYLYEKSVITMSPIEWHYIFNKTTDPPKCTPPDSEYLGNNLWINLNAKHNVDIEFMDKSKDKTILLAYDVYVTEFKALSMPTEDEFSDRQIKDIRNWFGLDNIFLHDKKLSVSMKLCQVVNVTKIIRSKKVGNVCFNEIPVIVGNRTMFTADGLEVFTSTQVVSCNDKGITACKGRPIIIPLREPTKPCKVMPSSNTFITTILIILVILSLLANIFFIWRERKVHKRELPSYSFENQNSIIREENPLIII